MRAGKRLVAPDYAGMAAGDIGPSPLCAGFAISPPERKPGHPNARFAVRLMKREYHAQCVTNTHGGVVGKKKKG
jgi:hypothetical protein